MERRQKQPKGWWDAGILGGIVLADLGLVILIQLIDWRLFRFVGWGIPQHAAMAIFVAGVLLLLVSGVGADLARHRRAAPALKVP